MHVHFGVAMQAKAFFGLTKEKAMEMAASEHAGHCLALKSLNKEMFGALQNCSPELTKPFSVVIEVCSGGSGTA